MPAKEVTFQQRAFSLAGLLLVIACAANTWVNGAEPSAPRTGRNAAFYRESLIQFWYADRIAALWPERRDQPARQTNVADTEVVEIKATMHKYVGDGIVNIGTVVTGCPCQDGPHCTDQVYVLVSGRRDTFGLLLSHISEHWVVGPLQQWYLDYSALGGSKGRMAYGKKIECFERTFPLCKGDVPGTFPSR